MREEGPGMGGKGASKVGRRQEGANADLQWQRILRHGLPRV